MRTWAQYSAQRKAVKDLCKDQYPEAGPRELRRLANNAIDRMTHATEAEDWERGGD
jgi:hypothetical protein